MPLVIEENAVEENVVEEVVEVVKPKRKAPKKKEPNYKKMLKEAEKEIEKLNQEIETEQKKNEILFIENKNLKTKLNEIEFTYRKIINNFGSQINNALEGLSIMLNK